MCSRYLPLLAAPLALAACQQPAYDPRGVDHDETLLSVSATGESEVRPDEAFFQVGVDISLILLRFPEESEENRNHPHLRFVIFYSASHASSFSRTTRQEPPDLLRLCHPYRPGFSVLPMPLRL